MTRYLTILSVAMLVACSGDDKGADTGVTGDDDDDTVGDDDDDDDATCANLAEPEYPVQGDADVYYRSAVRFSLDIEDTTATIAVADAGGTEVPGGSEVLGTTVSWTGDAPFTPSTEYTATLTFECGTSAVTFTTSNTGLPTEVDVTGSTYALDLASGQWVEPAGVGGILADQLGDTQIFVSPTEVAPTTVTMFGAIGAGDTQDLCSPTIPFPPANYTDPYFELQSPLLPLVIAGTVVEIQDLDLSGAFSPDGSRIQGALLAGLVDTRPLGVAFELGDDPGAVCEFVQTFGVSCIPCGDDEPYCLGVRVENIGAPAVPGLTLVPRTEQDVIDDPACQ